MGPQFTASSPQPLNTSPDESELTTPADPSLCPNTTQKHLRHPYTLGSLCQAKLFSHLLSVTSDCRPVRFSRRNVKAAWSERAGRISYLTWIIFNWHRSLSRQGPHSAPVAQKKQKNKKRDREKYENMSREEQEAPVWEARHGGKWLDMSKLLRAPVGWRWRGGGYREGAREEKGRKSRSGREWKGKKNKLSESLQKNEDIQVQIPAVHTRRLRLRILYGST